jgi:membrane associated rhomboid family serine protease
MPFDDVKRQGPGGRGSHERAINLPPALLWLIGINVAVQLVRQLLSEQVDQSLVLSFGLIPASYTSEPPGEWWSLLLAPITYQFIHGGWVHLGVNMITLAAFGAPVERLLGVRRFVLFYLSAGVVAGFIHVLFFSSSPDPVVGASGAISGVFGAVLMALRHVGRLNSLLPVAGVWIALNVFFGLWGGGPGTGGEPVAWTAHIGGFVYGLVAFRLFLPAALRAPPPQPGDGNG